MPGTVRGDSSPTHPEAVEHADHAATTDGELVSIRNLSWVKARGKERRDNENLADGTMKERNTPDCQY
jgi:hypothetical protein